MPRLAICSRDLHWHWINRTLLCDTMEVSMLSRAWLTIAQHVFQPALTGRPELILRKIVSGEPGTKAIAASRFREKLSPANWVQGVTAISRKISRSWAPKKWGPTCDRDISNSAIYTTAIYRTYTVLQDLLSNELIYSSPWWLLYSLHVYQILGHSDTTPVPKFECRGIQLSINMIPQTKELPSSGETGWLFCTHYHQLVHFTAVLPK